MKTINVTVTFDDAALVDLLTHAIEKGTTHCIEILERIEKGAKAEPVPLVPSAPPVAPPAQPVIVEKTPPSEKLLDAKAIAKMLGLSVRTIWRLSDGGQMPKPVRLGSAVRWKTDEINRWIESGCPKVEQRGVPKNRR
jgi:predicted DNA-binding transcriptional regulator AlpA